MNFMLDLSDWRSKSAAKVIKQSEGVRYHLTVVHTHIDSMVLNTEYYR